MSFHLQRRIAQLQDTLDTLHVDLQRVLRQLRFSERERQACAELMRQLRDASQELELVECVAARWPHKAAALFTTD